MTDPSKLTDQELSDLAWRMRGVDVPKRAFGQPSVEQPSVDIVTYPRDVALRVIARVTADRLRGCVCYCHPSYGFTMSQANWCSVCQPQVSRGEFRRLLGRHLAEWESRVAEFIFGLPSGSRQD
jgi:hypothetical protein